MQRKWMLTGGTFSLVGGLFLLFHFFNRQMVLEAQVDPLGLAVGEPLHYHDSTVGATTRHWQFGEGSTSDSSQGRFFYRKPGTYIVRVTVDETLSRRFTVQVIPRAVTQPRTLRLLADKVGYEGQKMVFKTFGAPVHRYAWQFGETKQVDSHQPTAFYVYSKPGRYKVTLTTDVTTQKLEQYIRILPRFSPIEKPIDTLAAAKTNDIQRRLQRIARGHHVNQQYTYLLKHYLCNQPNTLVVAGSLPAQDFYSYCMNLQFDPGWVIDAVDIKPDSLTHCITKLTVTQHQSE